MVFKSAIGEAVSESEEDEASSSQESAIGALDLDLDLGLEISVGFMLDLLGATSDVLILCDEGERVRPLRDSSTSGHCRISNC